MARYSTGWFRTEVNPEPRHGRMHCSYCNSEMNIVTVRTKRPVPPGAKDLDLYDELTCWQCPTCEAKSDEGIARCSCGAYAVDTAYAASAPQTPVRIAVYRGSRQDTFGCTNCEECGICDRPLAGHEYTWHNETTSVYMGGGGNQTVYFHQPCAERIRREQQQRQYLKDDEMSRAAGRQPVDVQEWEQEWEKERSQVEARRRAAGQCIVCGRPLGMMEKLTRRDTHSGCRR